MKIEEDEQEARLEEALEQVKDRDSFLAFVRALITDREMSVKQERLHPSNPYGPDAGGWENTRIETFFEAALAWADASDHFPAEPSWQSFAEFLYCGKIYE